MWKDDGDEGLQVSSYHRFFYNHHHNIYMVEEGLRRSCTVTLAFQGHMDSLLRCLPVIPMWPLRKAGPSLCCNGLAKQIWQLVR